MAALQGTLRANKRALRKSMAATLQALPTSSIQSQSQTITERILESPFFHKCRSVSCYLSMPTGEVDTAPLVHELIRSGKTLFVPKIDRTTDGRMEFLRLYTEEDLLSLPSGLWGIREPDYYRQGKKRMSALDVECAGLDVILLPGVAFDRSLSRLGHGKGYYDRFISSYTAFASEHGINRPLLVALALQQQVLEAGHVPTGEHDWKMDMIITPDEIIGPSVGS